MVARTLKEASLLKLKTVQPYMHMLIQIALEPLIADVLYMKTSKHYDDRAAFQVSKSPSHK